MMPVLARPKVTFLTRQTAIRKVVDRLVGFEGSSAPTGFRWDQRHVSLATNTETLPMPGIKDSHLNSLSRRFWQNGPIEGSKGNDLKVEKVERRFRSGTEQWLPILHSGNFSLWRNGDIFFSDNSVVEYLSSTALDVDGRSYHTLVRERKNGKPIRATIYKRSGAKEAQIWRDYLHRQAFTGILDSEGNQQTTRTDDTLFWDNVDVTKREFAPFVREERLFLQFNQNAVESVTSTSAPVEILDFNEKEFLGVSDGTSNQIFESEFFPISSTNLHVYVVNVTSGTWTEYTVVDSLTAANQVKIDTELGRFIFGTVATGGAPPVSHNIYISYQAVPRIEYEEVTYDELRTAIHANVNPLGQSLNKGFVVLTRSDLDIGTITLETDKPFYNNIADTFGPIYAGADHAKLTATVFSSGGKPVPNIEVTFQMEYEPATGSIGNSGVSSQHITAHDGKARTYYTTPNSALDMGYYVTSVTGTNQLQVRSDANFSEPRDIYTFYVLKDDPWIGKVGADTSIGEVEWVPSQLNGRKVILYAWDATAIHPITGIVGAYAPLIPTSISNGSLLTYSQTLESPDPSATVGSDNLGAYWVVSDRIISIQASAYSPRFQRRIFSNTIKLRVELPPYMKGVYVNDALQRIPFGMRVSDDTYNVASAIGGATFISINPIAGPYNIVDVIAGETLQWPLTEDTPYSYDGPSVERPFGQMTFTFTIG